MLFHATYVLEWKVYEFPETAIDSPTYFSGFLRDFSYLLRDFPERALVTKTHK